MSFRIYATLAIAMVVIPVAGYSDEVSQKPADPDHAAKMAAGLDLFKQEVRTVLKGRCLKCHGGDRIEGSLSLATRKELLAGGDSGNAIEPGDAAASLLMRLVTHEDEPVMPEDGAKLDQRQIDAIARWIDLGAPYDKPLADKEQEDEPGAWTRRIIDDSAREFWSLKPLQRFEPPELPEESWIRTPVDQFILARLREAEIGPNPPASRRTLIRRAYMDLIGLPPSPDEVAAFVGDEDPHAYEKLIDRLLANKHHGERVGRHWLDIARFAESHGFEQDYDRPHAYHYRDFVIKAFNDDMPYDQFVRWQLAGDEIDPTNPLAMMATGFLGAGVFPTQLTEKEFESSRYDELDDMVATMGTAMLGMTIGCARCHDHKFDPIPARDYYQLVSAFRTTIRSNVEIDLDPSATAAAMETWQAELAPLQRAIEEFEKNELPGRFDQFLETVRVRSKSEDATPSSRRTSATDGWITLAASKLHSEKGATFKPLDDGSYLASGKNANFDVYTFESETGLQGIRALRIEALADDSMKKRGPGRADNGNFALSRIELSAQPLGSNGQPLGRDGQPLGSNGQPIGRDDQGIDVPLVDPEVTFEQNDGNLSIASSLDDDPKSGWAVDPQFGKDHAATFRLADPIEFAEGARIRVRLEFNVNNKHNIGRLRIAVAGAAERPAIDAESIRQAEAELQTLKLAEGEQLSPARRSALISVYKQTDQAWCALDDALQTHLAARPKPNMATVMVCSEGVKPIPNHGDGRGFPHFYEDAYFLSRGDVNQKQGIAETGFLQVLVRAPVQDPTESFAIWKRSPPENATTSHRRRAVADWITDTERGAGDLLARVIVNRLWQQHLGRGIVTTPNDFGFQGERPTHPELLDWLAAELIRGDWRLKPIRKLIMTSSVYMQDSQHRSPAAEVDPDDSLFWRFSPRRLEAEIIRDSMLAISGQLDAAQFGPGSLDESMRRRSIYFMIKRSKLIPFLQVFDTPEPLTSVGQRPSTTVAPQALIFMNNPQVRQYARSFAQKINFDEQESIESCVTRAYMRAIAREPSGDELAASTSFVEQQIEAYQAESKPDARLLALTDLCQVLMSLSEFVYLD